MYRHSMSEQLPQTFALNWRLQPPSTTEETEPMPRNAFYEHALKQENYDQILIEKHPNGVAVATLTQPHKMNAVDPNMHREVTSLARDVDEDPDVKVLVLTGAGRAFCAGGDFSPGRPRFSGPRIFREARQMVDDFLDREKPIITAMNGPAMGLGATIALLGDVIIAGRSAKIGDTHVKVGSGAGDGGQLYWPLLMGINRAKYHMMTGEALSAEEAERLGLVDFVVDDEQLMKTAMDLADPPRERSQPRDLRLQDRHQQVHQVRLEPGTAADDQPAACHAVHRRRRGSDRCFPREAQTEFQGALMPCTDGAMGGILCWRS